MNKQDVIHFFDSLAPGWDAGLIKSDVIIEKILDNVEIEPGQDVLGGLALGHLQHELERADRGLARRRGALQELAARVVAQEVQVLIPDFHEAAPAARRTWPGRSRASR